MARGPRLGQGTGNVIAASPMPRRMARSAALLVLPLLLLAGCSDGGGGGETTTTTTTSASPATGTATAVEIVSVPASAAAGSKATVCFTVSGTGRVPHVAIHWDNASHAAEPTRTFAAYDLGASYPNNRTEADGNGYQLQATGARFCTALTMPAQGSAFVVAHAIDSTGAPGRLSTEREIDVTPGEAQLRMQGFAYQPAALQVPAGSTVTVQNADSVKHTVSGSGFDTGDVAGGATGTFIAPTAPGTYTFACAYHASMQGTLTVTQADA